MLRRTFLATCSAIAGLLIPVRESVAAVKTAAPPETQPKKYSLGAWLEWLDYQYSTNHVYHEQLTRVVDQSARHVYSGNDKAVARDVFRAIRDLLHSGNAFVTPWAGGLGLVDPKHVQLQYDELTDRVLPYTMIYKTGRSVQYDELTDRVLPYTMIYKTGRSVPKSTTLAAQAMPQRVVQMHHVALRGNQAGWCLPLWYPETPMPTAYEMRDALIAGKGLDRLRKILDAAIFVAQVREHLAAPGGQPPALSLQAAYKEALAREYVLPMRIVDYPA
jgi:hypothetical protein